MVSWRAGPSLVFCQQLPSGHGRLPLNLSTRRCSEMLDESLRDLPVPGSALRPGLSSRTVKSRVKHLPGLAS